ncbi:Phosphatidic acid phosphatase type 2/haloperoxidase [Parasponia andersonii]|uniref:Phosphatidic acid phosphatase type 2/haloperoxidase n=1 Tax=Parasponia andersonii TaxID=3476 RepID=A0A2P5BCT3_PARAD|nr:Phosphatidic acid phosphatase type 2/haloperoxidase [Parasponia andersonii]
MESIAAWQAATLCGIVSWIVIASYLNVTQKLRSLIQPWVTHHVLTGTPLIIRIQNYQHGLLDALFSGLSCVVSVPFYTAFLPLLFWSGHGKLARQMTLLMAFCDYIGNCIKDVVSAPRPSCPPIRRITATKDEEENAMEYGLPSSHTLNTVCLSGYYPFLYLAHLFSVTSQKAGAYEKRFKLILKGNLVQGGDVTKEYLLQYVLSHAQLEDGSLKLVGIFLVCLIVGLIGFGRIYLGMHSLVDIIGGLAMGLVVLAFWLTVHEYIDNFVVSGQNVTTFWAALSILLLFAYPTPEFPTPSYEFHTAFNGVALGIVTGVQQTYNQFHHEAIPRIFTPQLSIPAFLGRMLVGIPTILLVKFCSKALSKWILPIVSNTLGIPIRSTSYIPALSKSSNGKKPKKSDEFKQSGYLQKLFFFSNQDTFDVDTGIRFLQYAGLAYSVVDLVPSLFSHLSL